jgi:hypothetical protein
VKEILLFEFFKGECLDVKGIVAEALKSYMDTIVWDKICSTI